MDIFSIIFLASVFVGLWMGMWVLLRFVFLLGCLAGNRTLQADYWFSFKAFLWLACSTYNCWYLFVKGL